MNAVPPSLAANPLLSRWIGFGMPGRVSMRTGKVEIGQGIVTALAQIAAEELEVGLDRIDVTSGHTRLTPDEGWTSASISIEVGGAALRLVCAEVRHLFLQAAARALNLPPEDVVLRDGIFGSGAGREVSYWTLAAEVPLDRDWAGLGVPRAPAAHRVVGTSPPRRDLLAKLLGGAFLHDLERPGMLHGRILRAPHPDCRLEAFDEAAARTLPGVAGVLVDGALIGLWGAREEAVAKAAEHAAGFARWAATPSIPLSEESADLLDDAPAERQLVLRRGEPEAAPGIRIRGCFSKPFIAHASIGPACAVAEWRDGRLTVWSHSQGVFPLRAALARVLGLALEEVEVIHREGAGCYGHNGADDVALEAALLSRAAGAPMRVLWSRAEELSAAPLGSAMRVEVEAALDGDGRISGWRQVVRSFTHLCRPGWGEGVNLLAARQLARPFAPSAVRDPPQKPWGGGGDRNAIPLYDIPAEEVVYDLVTEAPFRTSALRALGAFANVFAIESMMDMLAEAAGADPLAFRLAHLSDPRAAAVLRAAAHLAGWRAGQPGTGEWGRGLGFARYKNSGAYCAVVAEVAIGQEVRVSRVHAALDAGLLVNPDGVRAQVEGGIIQALSWTLKEAVPLDSAGPAARSWEDYPILRFDEVPEIEVATLADPRDPPLGVGECAAGPVAGAVANALAHALGLRVTGLPLTPARIAAAMG